MQLKKLAVICNACFWLTLIFQVWEHARDIHQLILNSVVILGILAVIINLCWITIELFGISQRNSSQKIIIAGGTTGADIKGSRWLFNSFNLLSFISQLILLGIKVI
jgi:hypothetical protein